jgi:hypothetical protein
MKYFTKISGIIGGIICLVSLVLICVGFFESNHGDEKLIIFLLLIPLYFVTHFFIKFKFGFIEEMPLDVRSEQLLYKVSFIFIIAILFTGISLSVSYLFHKSSRGKLSEKYSVMKKWDVDTTAYGLIGRLQTKFENDKLFYNFSIESDTLNRYKLENINSYKINFLDKDGFILDEITVSELINRIDSKGELIGKSKNSNTYNRIEEYSKFYNWDLICFEK